MLKFFSILLVQTNHYLIPSIKRTAEVHRFDLMKILAVENSVELNNEAKEFQLI